jgi:imidazolonepropionase-like amidohydrolase
MHDVVLRNATVIDVETGALDGGRTIAIDDSIISFIGSDDEQRHRGLTEVDATDLYTIPGLWDMHVHIEGADLVEDNRLLFPVYLAYGVTTVRDMASDLGEQVLEWRDEINQERLLGPRIYTAGRKIEGVNSVWRDDLEIANEAEMHAMMDRLDEYEVDFVKVTENTLEADLFLSTVREAVRRGYRVSGHVPYGTTIEQVAQAGISSIEHASHMVRLGSGDEQQIAAKARTGTMTRGEAQVHYAESFSQERARLGYEMLAEHGVYVTPTLVGSYQTAYLDERDHDADEYRRYLTEAFMAPYAARGARILDQPSAQRQRAKENYARVAAQVPEMVRAGIGLLGGSDSAPIAIYVYPGLALHQELQLFQEAGLSPLEALQSVTINGARFLGEEERAGSLHAGKLASLVLLRENPLADISATLSIAAVVSRGRWLDRAALDALLEEAAARAAILDADRR